MSELQNYLNLETTQMPVAIKEFGIPTDSVPGKTGEAAMSEFQIWVKAAHEANPDAKIAIKADEKTPYKTVKKIMSELQDMNENRYYLITQYKKTED
jgi:biopolymer transport protein ExbD